MFVGACSDCSICCVVGPKCRLYHPAILQRVLSPRGPCRVIWGTWKGILSELIEFNSCGGGDGLKLVVAGTTSLPWDSRGST